MFDDDNNGDTEDEGDKIDDRHDKRSPRGSFQADDDDVKYFTPMLAIEQMQTALHELNMVCNYNIVSE